MGGSQCKISALNCSAFVFPTMLLSSSGFQPGGPQKGGGGS